MSRTLLFRSRPGADHNTKYLKTRWRRRVGLQTVAGGWGASSALAAVRPCPRHCRPSLPGAGVHCGRDEATSGLGPWAGENPTYPPAAAPFWGVDVATGDLS